MEENKDEIIENEEVTEEDDEEESEESDAEEEKKGKKEKKKLTPEEKAALFRKFMMDFFEIVESTVITIFLVIMLFTYVLHPVNIVGHSMVPTFNTAPDGSDTDKIFMTTVYFSVDYGDILVIDKDKNYLLDNNGEAYESETPAINECIIKRVIAKGGQTVDIKGGLVYVDGEVLNEPYINEKDSTKDSGAFTGQYPITIPEGYYFCMGDNRNHSTDSRSMTVGLVKKDQIYGKAVIKYAPFDEFRILTDSWKG